MIYNGVEKFLIEMGYDEPKIKWEDDIADQPNNIAQYTQRTAPRHSKWDHNGNFPR